MKAEIETKCATTRCLSRRAFAAVAAAAAASLLFGCSSESDTADVATDASTGKTLVVGTLATEDILPLWVAQSEGLFDDAGLDVQIMPFQSATELIAGVASGDAQMAMTDIMVTASMFASDIDVNMQWVTLGTSADQGRFGIMAGPDSSIEQLTDLAGVPIGVGSNTILEYVMDKLMEAAGIPEEQIVVEELQKLPVRYQAMASGEVAAAALPGTLLALGEANGCKLIADDTSGENLSQSVMIARADLLASDGGVDQVEALKGVWDAAVQMINDDPEAYRSVLVANANLPEEIADTYPISTYPTAQLPTSEMVDPVLEWMEHKGYLTQPLAYDAASGSFAAA